MAVYATVSFISGLVNSTADYVDGDGDFDKIGATINIISFKGPAAVGDMVAKALVKPAGDLVETTATLSILSGTVTNMTSVESEADNVDSDKGSDGHKSTDKDSSGETPTSETKEED